MSRVRACVRACVRASVCLAFPVRHGAPLSPFGLSLFPLSASLFFQVDTILRDEVSVKVIGDKPIMVLFMTDGEPSAGQSTSYRTTLRNWKDLVRVARRPIPPRWGSIRLRPLIRTYAP